ncbi:hypothetical protein ACU5AX_08200 [Sphingomonas sp. XXL09]|uniref:hypothetical protein n=1 Tax=Sphingomonas sp. XXL09 TaxID=3457787 RepID=UPI00406BD5C5
MRVRLNVWMRLAIVVTGLWLIGATLTIHMMTMNQRVEFAGRLYSMCYDGFSRLQDQYPPADYSKNKAKCSQDSSDYLDSEPSALSTLGMSFLGSAVVAVIAWVLGGIAYVVVRWVLRGRSGTA